MSSDLILRPTEERDLAAIAAIYGDQVLTGSASYELEPPEVEEMTRRWRALVDTGFPYFVAERQGKIVGYAYAGPYRPRPAYRFSVENSVYVAPEAQRTGVGKALLTEVIQICERLGFRQMIAVIGGGTEHRASVGLHAAHGFHVVGVIEGSGFKHGRWLDTTIMQRPLGPGKAAPPDRP